MDIETKLNTIESQIKYLTNLVENHLMQKPGGQDKIKKIMEMTVNNIKNTNAGRENPEIVNMIEGILAPIISED